MHTPLHTSALAGPPPATEQRTGRWLRRLPALAFLGLLGTSAAQAQVVRTLPGTYASLSAAITDLNTNGVPAGGVTIDVAAGYTETAINLTLTATGTSTSPIVFQKAGTGANPLVTAATGSTSTTLDAIIKLVGSDYVTFDGIDLAENAANTTAATQAEFGYALFRTSATDGSQYNVIKNCVVTLNKTNANTIGIYGANSLPTATTALAVTSADGSNSNNKVFGNVVSNAATGVQFSGSSAAGFLDANNEVGGPVGNTIGNFGSTTTNWGIGGSNQIGFKVVGNTINSTLNYTSATASTPVAASTVTSTLRGVYTPSGTSANIDITNNIITLASGGTTAQMSGVENGAGNTAANNTVNISNNTVSLTYTTATSATVHGIYNSASPATVVMSGNTLSATLSNTGTTFMLDNNSSAASITALNNQVTSLSRTGASGAVYGYYNNASGTGTQTVSNNTFNNVTVAGTSTFYGVYSNTSGSETQIRTGNTVSNITGGTGAVYGMFTAYGTATSQFSNNTVTGISTGGTIYGLYFGNTAFAGYEAFGNTVSALSTTGTSSIIYGIYTSSTTSNVFRNKVYNLSGTGTGLTIYGIGVLGGTTVTVYNNLVGDLRAPAATGTAAISGLYVSSGTNVNLYYNTVYLNATSTGATFGTSGIYFTTTPTSLDLRNNVVVNKSTAAGTGGYTAALRRASGTAGTVPANLASTTNNNLYYAGTPSATNLIYVEGTTTATNASQTLTDYKSLVAPRELASQTEDVPFLSTTGTDATFLHINPAVPTLVEGKGQPISSITTDFDGDTRNTTTPDLGADEGTFIPGGAAVDVAATGLVSPAATGCYGSAESVTVAIQNNGTAALDFAANPATVTVNVTGPVTQTLTATVNTGTLAPGATQSVSVGTLNMSAAGTYSFAIAATATGDGNTANDNIVVTRSKTAVAAQPQQLNFTGLTATNLSTLYPGWYEATGATLPTGTTSAWTADDFGNVVGGPNGTAAKINLFSTGKNDWIVGPRILATASTLLSYDLALNTFGATTVGTLGSDDRLEVRVSADCGLTFTAVKTYTASTVISNTGQLEQINLGNYAGQEIIVAFFATEGTVDDTNDNDLFIDNVNLGNGAAVDLAPVALLTPPTGQTCYSTAENVTVSVRNIGTAALDFAANPATVTVNVTGPVTQTLTATVNTGTLAPGATQSVSVGTLNMSAAGTYSFAIAATATGDGNTANDNLATPTTRVVTAPVAGTITPSAASLCVSGTVTLALTGSSNGSIQWQQSTDNVTFTDISGATSATYTSGVLTSTTYFQARTVCNAAVATSNVATVTINNPQITTTNSPVAICEGSTATLTATAAAGTTVRFFDAASGGTALATGTSFTTPALTASRQYFVEATTSSTETVGRLAPAATTSTTASSYGLVFNSTAATQLVSVDVYPAGTAGNLVVQVQDNTGTLIPGLTATVAIPAGTGTTPFTVPLNFTLPVGTGMRLIAVSSPAMVRESSLGGFPYVSPSGNVSITNGYISGTSTTYYYFYNWQVSAECTGTRAPIQVNVTPAPTATLPATAATCAATAYQLTGSVGGSATTGTYTSTGTGTFSPNATTLNATYTPSAADATAGSVTITLTADPATGSGCSTATAQTVLTITPATTATFSYPATTLCVSGTASTPTVTGTAGGTFSSTTGLSLNATTGVITPGTSTPGTYTVTYSVAGTCPSSATTSVTITTAPVATFSYANAAYCAGASGTATPVFGTGASAGTFSASGTGLVLNATTGAINLSTSAAGTYTVTNAIAASGGCAASTATASVTITARPAQPTVSPVYNGTTTTLTSSSATGNQWYLNGTLIPGATNPTYVVNSAAQFGQYTVVVTNATTGCASLPSAQLLVNSSVKVLAGSSLSVYPNPTADGNVTVELSGYTKATELTVYNAVGQQVYHSTAAGKNDVQTATLDLRQLPAGVYILRARTESGFDVRRITKQ
ncbi:T9SS type A sorting domain-containing protein [Microvirga sp. STR05]|uniref:T9SS type A sorting domain-containing protein n=1 Tax=Hymenobacter duratus TaxID=2771356 RepID=A0ABR8JDW4_9BACT|nr:T9SS type A sorting domain-containing protein [Hymenobacter duratus]MBD2713818.1 T9SS type A sorting domain-containing protein [Hymenobacter duratus]MBR7948720.1 T9SS type A sorting domain-containing protein [Microvirga sp. STR05]